MLRFDSSHTVISQRYTSVTELSLLHSNVHFHGGVLVRVLLDRFLAKKAWTVAKLGQVGTLKTTESLRRIVILKAFPSIRRLHFLSPSESVRSIFELERLDRDLLDRSSAATGVKVAPSLRDGVVHSMTKPANPREWAAAFPGCNVTLMTQIRLSMLGRSSKLRTHFGRT